jgi:hypothetical protein
MPIEVVDVVSTMISEARFDDQNGTASFVMKSGKSYDAPLTPDQWAEFKDAPSKGKWFRQQIMGLER